MERKLWKKIFALFAIVGVFGACGILESADNLQRAPLNPEFVKFLKEGKTGKSALKSADGHLLGGMPEPVDLSHAKYTKAAGKKYPASYDLRTQGKVSSVKDQGMYGTCWAFGTYGSMESNLMPLVPEPDFSEDNLANNAGFDNNYNGGGQANMSTAYLARWSGAIAESDDPYGTGNPGYAPPLTVKPQKHVQDVIFLPERTSFTDNDLIKEILTTHGACQISFLYAAECYNGTSHAYYYNTDTSTNHIVTLIGWDDNFSAGNFKNPPAGNGAFLMKNSWGTSWGDQGYFWISYYDTSFSYARCFFESEAVTNYTGISQYDTLGWVSSLGNNVETEWGANIFTAGSADPIQAVSTYAVSSGCTIEVRVYTGVTAGNPVSGNLAGTVVSTIDLPGYYTIPLEAPVPVSKGQLFSIVIKYTTPGNNYPMPCEYAISGYSSAAVALSGQSFYSDDGATWGDLFEVEPTANICIKAFGPAPSNGETGAAFHVTIGSEFYVYSPVGQFDAKPDCYAAGGQAAIKKKSIKILKGEKPEYPCSAVRAQWTAKLAPDAYSLCVKRKVKGQKPEPEVVSNGFFVQLPEATYAQNNIESGVRTIVITGLNFGTKKPKVYAKYLALNGKEKKVSFKVSEFDQKSIVSSVNESVIQKLRDKGVIKFSLVIENTIGVNDTGWPIE